MERHMLANMGTNILAKAYSVECMRFLRIAVKHVCTGCQNDQPLDAAHYVCLGNIPDQLYYASDILPGMIDERRVTDLFIHFVSELHLPLSTFPQELFDIETRHAHLEDPDFWDLIASYALPWVEPPFEDYITDDEKDEGIEAP